MTAAINHFEPDETPANPPWRLNDRDIAALLHAAEVYARVAPTVSPAVTRAAWKLSAMTADLAAMSRRHQPSRDVIDWTGNSAQTIDTGEAARILKRNTRWVQRHQHELGGRLDGRGRLCFDAGTVAAYAVTHEANKGGRHA